MSISVTAANHLEDSLQRNLSRLSLVSLWLTRYTPLESVAIILSVTVVFLLVVVGNGLVIIAILSNRRLKGTQHWFLASLALADLLLAVLIMPFSLVNQLLGVWVFGTTLCSLWLAVDVLLCTASILHLCLISLDRYLSISRPLDYPQLRTSLTVSFMILGVWLLAAVISLPPLVGWKEVHHFQQRQEDTQTPIMVFAPCELTENIGYVLYSTCGSFYIPLVVILIVYCRIFTVARRRITSGGRLRTNHKTYAFSTVTHHESEAAFCLHGHDAATGQVTFSLGILPPTPGTGQRVLVPHRPDHHHPHMLLDQETITIKEEPDPSPSRNSSGDSGSNKSPSVDMQHPWYKRTPPLHHPLQATATVSPVLQDHVRTTSHPHRTPPHTTVQGTGGTHWNHCTRRTSTKYHMSDDELLRRRRRGLARQRERRAILVLGLILGAFVLCWFPFFTIYVIQTLCGHCIPEAVFTFFFWLGYCNSALNPIIYTVFNREFRLAFRDLLRCRNRCTRPWRHVTAM